MSEIKVNKISPRTNCGTVTLGDSGDTFTIPAGATITNNGTAAGFGATGAASWDTTVKTGDFTAVNGVGYFVDTTSGEVDVALPAGTAGAVVAVADYANTADTNNIILKQNGSEKIEGSTDDFTVNVEGASITLVYVDSTKGWIITDTGQSTDAFESPFICATGGTITNTPTCRIHTFTGPGTFTVNSIGRCSSNNVVGYMVVGGGAAGGANNNNNNGSGGGGAGGFREGRTCSVTPYTVSPLAVATGITVTASDFPITIGAGGAAQSPGPAPGNAGSNSIFSTITSAGGGGGNAGNGSGAAGGSGGGSAGPSAGGAGNTPPTSPSQGQPGGSGWGSSGPSYGGGAGGGAGGAGNNGGPSGGGAGGVGVTTHISAGPLAYAGGGGGGAYSSGTKGNASPCGTGGSGGNGCGSQTSGTTNRGGGGGGNNQPSGTSGAGGSGVVIIRYKIA